MTLIMSVCLYFRESHMCKNTEQFKTRIVASLLVFDTLGDASSVLCETNGITQQDPPYPLPRPWVLFPVGPPNLPSLPAGAPDPVLVTGYSRGVLARKRWDVNPAVAWCWAIAADGGPTLGHPLVSKSCLLSYPENIIYRSTSAYSMFSAG